MDDILNITILVITAIVTTRILMKMANYFGSLLTRFLLDAWKKVRQIRKTI